MEWFVLNAQVPAAADFSLAAGGLVAAGLFAAVTPLVLAARASLLERKRAAGTPQLRIVDGGRELSRRAA